MASEDARPSKEVRVFSIVKGLFLILLTGCVVFFALNPKYLLERITEIRTEERGALVESRLKSDVEIGAALSGLLAATGADRAWLIELHNGSEDIATGLPFLYGSMRMEEVREGVYHVDEEYSDFVLSKYDARRAFFMATSKMCEVPMKGYTTNSGRTMSMKSR